MGCVGCKRNKKQIRDNKRTRVIPLGRVEDERADKRLQICKECDTYKHGWCGKPGVKAEKSTGEVVVLFTGNKWAKCPQNKWMEKTQEISITVGTQKKDITKRSSITNN